MVGRPAANEAEIAGRDPAPILLPVVCALRETETLLDALTALPKDAEIVLDANEVEQMSSACVLTVVSAIRDRENSGGSVVVLQPSSAFVDAFNDLGLFADLKKMEFR